MTSKLNLNALPRDLQLLVGSFLPGQDIQQAAKVSKVIQKVFEDPRLWQQVAAKLNIKINDPKNPQADVLNYYKKTNEAALRCLRPKNIRRSSDVYEQNQIIELYIAENKDALKDELLVAAREGDVGLVRMLLQANVPMDENLLMVAIREGYIEIAKLLLKANAPIGERSLFMAIREGHKEIVKLLLKANAPIGERFLVVAAREGHKEIVELLLKANAPKNPEATESAARRGHKDILIMLIKAGVPLSKDTDVVNIPIMEHQTEIIEILLNAGFKPTEENLDLARRKGTPEIVELLRAAMLPPHA